jgi:RNA polymerase sigma factor (sigma-70 family)
MLKAILLFSNYSNSLREDHTITENELLLQLANEDPAALEALIDTYFPVLCRFAEKYLPDASLAKDVVQETFINFWNARQVFTSVNALKGYLFISTRNGCLNLLRGREREAIRNREVADNDTEIMESVMTGIVRAENLALVYQVVRGMSKPMQEIFYLSYKEGLTVKQIADRLDMKLMTVKSHKYKTLLILRHKFGKTLGATLLFLTLLPK